MGCGLGEQGDGRDICIHVYIIGLACCARLHVQSDLLTNHWISSLYVTTKLLLGKKTLNLIQVIIPLNFLCATIFHIYIRFIKKCLIVLDRVRMLRDVMCCSCQHDIKWLLPISAHSISNRIISHDRWVGNLLASQRLLRTWRSWKRLDWISQ